MSRLPKSKKTNALIITTFPWLRLVAVLAAVVVPGGSIILLGGWIIHRHATRGPVADEP